MIFWEHSTPSSGQICNQINATVEKTYGNSPEELIRASSGDPFRTSKRRKGAAGRKRGRAGKMADTTVPTSTTGSLSLR